MNLNWDIAVIGAGAAGILAAARAAERGKRTLLIEKNRKPGTKILMSGGTRCNLTHATDAAGIVAAFGKAGKFLHSSLAALSPADLVALIEEDGVPTKVEANGKIFPASDRASDVLAALLRRLRRSGCTMVAGEGVVHLAGSSAGFEIVTDLHRYTAEKVIVTTGGKSYPGCGTTGDGYQWLAALGHTLVTPRPALTPLTTDAAWVASLSGVTLADVSVSVLQTDAERACLARERGSFLFTHFGLSGPAVLNVSRAVTAHPRSRDLILHCDFVPALRPDEMEKQLKHLCNQDGKKQLSSLLTRWLPRRLAEALAPLAGITGRVSAELSRGDRQQIAQMLKATPIPISGTRGFKKAEVTAGGVKLEEIDSRTMQSKLVENLYVAGEILDLDGPIGGYNFQSAFSTGWLAGDSV